MERIASFIRQHRKICITAGAAAAVLILAVAAFFAAAGGREKKETPDKAADSGSSQQASVENEQEPEQETETSGGMEPGEDGPAGQEMDISEVVSNEEYFKEITAFGIDVSKYQGKIDWNAVKNSGVGYAMIRIGARAEDTGEIVEDAYAAYNMQQATGAGIPVGVYFVSAAVSQDEAEEEAEWVVQYIRRYAISYPVVFDCERYMVTDSRMYGLDREARTDNAVAFMNRVSRYGYEAMAYVSLNAIEKDGEWDGQRLRAAGRLWVAYYPESGSVEGNSPKTSGSYDMWQYTQNGTVPGISAKVDLNAAYFQHGGTIQPENGAQEETVNSAEAGITFTEKEEQVTAKEETNLRTLPDESGQLVATIYNGDIVTRTATGSNGWSRLIYNGQTVYAKTQLLTTDLEPPSTSANVTVNGIEFYPHEDLVTAKEETNLRSVPSSESSDTIVATIQNGTYVKRIGMSERGWSRLEYEGQIVFAISSYLTN